MSLAVGLDSRLTELSLNYRTRHSIEVISGDAGVPVQPIRWLV